MGGFVLEFGAEKRLSSEMFIFVINSRNTENRICKYLNRIRDEDPTCLAREERGHPFVKAHNATKDD